MREGLDDYLEQQSLAGARHSRGKFSVNFAAAQNKISQAGLETPESAVLRLVQLGLNSGVKELDITLASDSVTIWLRDFHCGLLKNDATDEPLLTLLLACVSTKFERLEFLNHKACWQISRDGMKELKRRPCLSHCVCIKLIKASAKSFWAALRQNLSQRCDLHKVLYDKLKYCPIQLVLDGREMRLADCKAKTPDGQVSVQGPGDLLTWGLAVQADDEGYIVNDPLLGRRYYINERWGKYESLPTEAYRVKANPSYFDPTHSGWQPGSFTKRCQLALLRWSDSEPQGGEIEIVNRGVLVGTAKWPYPGHVRGVVSGLGLDMDLSNLRVVQNDKLYVLLEYLAAVLRAKVKDGV